MITRRHKFVRLVVGLQSGTPATSVQAAARLAATLQLDLLGLVLAESSLHDLASIPFAREITLTGSWRPIDFEQISRDVAFRVQELEQMFAAAVQGLSIATEFQIRRGSVQDCVAEFSRAEDILVISEPEKPADRAAAQFAWFVEAAYRSPAAVLLLPRAIIRSSGSIMAIAATADDPSIAAAALIAEATNERLIIVDTGQALDGEGIDKHSGIVSGQNVKHIGMSIEQLRAHVLFDSNLPNIRERLIVLTRGDRSKSTALAIASEREVPVLVV